MITNYDELHCNLLFKLPTIPYDLASGVAYAPYTFVWCIYTLNHICLSTKGGQGIPKKMYFSQFTNPIVSTLMLTAHKQLGKHKWEKKKTNYIDILSLIRQIVPDINCILADKKIGYAINGKQPNRTIRIDGIIDPHIGSLECPIIAWINSGFMENIKTIILAWDIYLKTNIWDLWIMYLSGAKNLKVSPHIYELENIYGDRWF